MNSIRFLSTESNNENQSTSNSTIQLEFNESVVQMLATTHDMNSNSCASLHRYNSRKRCASRESQSTRSHEEEDYIRKKQRNNQDQRTFSPIHRSQHIVSLSETDETQSQKKIICQRSVSMQDICDHRLDWLKDFMRQSLDTIRDTVVEACLTAMSARSMTPFHSNITTQDINVNNHLNRLARSEQSLASRKTRENWQQHHQVGKPSKNDLSLVDHRLDHTVESSSSKIQRIHYRARTNPYPMYQNVSRTPVNDIRVPWSYDWPQYRPTTFTAEEIYVNPGADPDLLKSSSLVSLHFNAIDGAIDRRSVYHRYYIRAADGLPLNPIGRTGLQGRGSLLRWGPNIYHYILICRWKRDNNGRLFQHPSNGRKMLEILLEMQTDHQQNNDLILTGGLRMIDSRFPPQLQDRLKRFLLQTEKIFNDRKRTMSSLVALDHLFEQNPIAWKGAYFDDARNTDNAWIELSIEYFFDSDHQFTSCIPDLYYEQLNHLDQPKFVWKDVQHTMDIGPRTHYRLIENLASKFNAYF